MSPKVASQQPIQPLTSAATIAPPTGSNTVTLKWNYNNPWSVVVVFHSSDLTNWQIVKTISLTNTNCVLPANDGMGFFTAGVFESKTNVP